VRTLSALSLVVSLLTGVGAAGCAGGSDADERVRRYFAVPPDAPLDDTVALRAAILRRVPLGTPASAVAAYLARVGLGRDPHTAYYPPDSARRAVARVELEPVGLFNIVQPEYAIAFDYDAALRLRDVRVRRWMTGP
jgi:hypothetical protein